MKIFLIEAPYNYGAMKAAIKRHFPLGLAYIAAYLKKNLNNAVIELFLEDINANFYLLLRKRIAKFAPDLIGISSMTPSFYSAYEICRFIKQEFDIPIVLGGQHASALRAEILTDDAPFDFIVYGEGENTALELCEKLDNRHTDFENVKGLIFRKDGRIITAQPRPLISDVDTIPHPARELADLTNFGAHSYIKFGRNAATLISSRGCAFNCSFCASNLTMGRGYRFHSPSYVVNEIKELVYRYKVDSLVFEDDTFTLNRERLETICGELIKEKMNVSWYCLSRVDAIDEDIVRLMREAGCRMINFGIESGNEKILEAMDKNITLNAARKAIRVCQKAGLRTQCTFILGFPGETNKTMSDTFRFAKELHPAVAVFFPFTPYPGTGIFDSLPEKLKPKSQGEWKNYLMTAALPAFCFVKDCSRKVLSRKIKLYTLGFFLRPRQILEILKTIKSGKELFEIVKSFWLFIIRITGISKRNCEYAKDR